MLLATIIAGMAAMDEFEPCILATFAIVLAGWNMTSLALVSIGSLRLIPYSEHNFSLDTSKLQGAHCRDHLHNCQCIRTEADRAIETKGACVCHRDSLCAP